MDRKQWIGRESKGSKVIGTHCLRENDINVSLNVEQVWQARVKLKNKELILKNCSRNGYNVHVHRAHYRHLHVQCTL